MIAVSLLSEDRGWRVTIRAMIAGAAVRVDRWFATRDLAIAGQQAMLDQLGVAS